MELSKISWRRVPQQARSQQRVDKILNAADEIFGEVGYDHATTNAIANRAGTSIGSLYRFFPDKTAIFHALCLRYLEEMSQILSTILTPKIFSLPVHDLVEVTIETFDQYFATHPGFRTVFLYSELSPEIQEIDMALTKQIASELEKLLAPRTPHLDPQRRYLIAMVSMELVNGLHRLIALHPKEFQKNLNEEFKFVLASYLKNYLQDH